MTGAGYDAAGNMISNGGATYTYDAENRLAATAGFSYVYDGDGQRVKKCANAGCTTGTLYWGGAGTDTLLESTVGGSNTSEYIFFNGKRVAWRDVSGGAVFYYFADHLGSASVITDASGVIKEESDYYPYGGEIPVVNNDPNKYKFTGKERDAESGLDNFPSRYYGSSLGRWMSPDPMGGHLEDPQSLNRYAYVGNDPVNAVDPVGLYLGGGGGGGGEGDRVGCLEFDPEDAMCGGGGGSSPTLGVGPVGGKSSHGGGGGDGFQGPNKAKVLRRLLEPKCAALFGGLKNALKALALTQYLPYSQAPQDAQDARKKDPLVNAYTVSHTTYDIPQPRVPAMPVDVTTYIAPEFFNQTQNDREVEQIHELLHGVGYSWNDPSPLDPSKKVDSLDNQQRNDIDKLCPENDVQTE
jgi:RHS repeat-associated protein